MTTRAEVVQEAREWLGTPTLHQASLRGVGADCIGLVKGVARNRGIVSAALDLPADYKRTPDGNLLALAREHMTEIPKAAMQPGDVVVVTFDTEPQHFGILGDYRHGGLSIIHALNRVGRVVETRLLFSQSMRFVAAFNLPGVE